MSVTWMWGFATSFYIIIKSNQNNNYQWNIGQDELNYACLQLQHLHNSLFITDWELVKRNMQELLQLGVSVTFSISSCRWCCRWLCTERDSKEPKHDSLLEGQTDRGRGLILQAGVDLCIQEALFHKQDNKISVRLQVTYDKPAGSRYLTRWLFWFTFYSSV